MLWVGEPNCTTASCRKTRDQSRNAFFNIVINSESNSDLNLIDRAALVHTTWSQPNGLVVTSFGLPAPGWGEESSAWCAWVVKLWTPWRCQTHLNISLSKFPVVLSKGLQPMRRDGGLSGNVEVPSVFAIRTSGGSLHIFIPVMPFVWVFDTMVEFVEANKCFFWLCTLSVHHPYMIHNTCL